MTVGQSGAPFLDIKRFIVEEFEAKGPESRTTLAIRSPFISVYELANVERIFDCPVCKCYRELFHRFSLQRCKSGWCMVSMSSSKRRRSYSGKPRRTRLMA